MQVSRRSQVDPFIVMDVMEAAMKAEAQGRSIIHMEVGQPGTPAPKGARDALALAMEGSPLGYTTALGLPELRAGIAAHYKKWYGVTVSPERVVITAGSSAAFLLAFTALFDVGDRVGVGLPGYPSYRQILRALSLKDVGFETSEDNRFQPDPSDLVGLDLKGLIVASPANPSGTILTRDALSKVIEACKQAQISLVSDEIYHGIQYGERAVSALELSDDIYVINSFSKYFSMTGWRIGWMIVPEDHVRTVERLAQNMFICAPHAAQIAALGALDCEDELEGNLEVYKANRALMLEELPKAGFTRFAPPDGAFYIYADVREFTDDSVAFSAEILEKAGVSVTPGLDFDPERGAHWMRFSYARGTEDIREGLARLKQFMTERGHI